MGVANADHLLNGMILQVVTHIVGWVGSNPKPSNSCMSIIGSMGMVDLPICSFS